MGSAPQVSVVVPTRNRAQLLRRLVDCLREQHGVPSIELIVVDDCSDDDTASLLAELQAEGPLAIRTARTPSPSGAAAARNIGCRLARAPIVAFTDDDCRPRPDWLACILQGFDHHDVVQGATLFDPAEAVGRGPFSQVVCVERWSGQFETSNVAYRRALIEQLGGFDEGFEGDSFGEDVDLGWRAVEAGARTTFVSGAVVVHDVKRGTLRSELAASLRHGWRWRHIARVLRDHPGYRPHRLYKDPFLAATHPPTLAALVGLTALALRPRSAMARSLGLVSVSWWVRHRIVVEPRPGPREQLAKVLPATFVVDAAEVLTVAYSAARYRTLVL